MMLRKHSSLKNVQQLRACRRTSIIYRNLVISSVCLKNPPHTVTCSCVYRRITWGKFANCGQTCIAPDYILCEPCIQGRVVECIRQTLLVKETLTALLTGLRSVSTPQFGFLILPVTQRRSLGRECGTLLLVVSLNKSQVKLTPSDPSQEFYGPDPKSSPDYGRIISRRHFNRIMGLMEGYTAVVGGQSDASQRYIGGKLQKKPRRVLDCSPQGRGLGIPEAS